MDVRISVGGECIDLVERGHESKWTLSHMKSWISGVIASDPSEKRYYTTESGSVTMDKPRLREFIREAIRVMETE